MQDICTNTDLTPKEKMRVTLALQHIYNGYTYFTVLSSNFNKTLLVIDYIGLRAFTNRGDRAADTGFVLSFYLSGVGPVCLSSFRPVVLFFSLLCSGSRHTVEQTHRLEDLQGELCFEFHRREVR